MYERESVYSQVHLFAKFHEEYKLVNMCKHTISIIIVMTLKAVDLCSNNNLRSQFAIIFLAHLVFL